MSRFLVFAPMKKLLLFSTSCPITQSAVKTTRETFNVGNPQVALPSFTTDFVLPTPNACWLLYNAGICVTVRASPRYISIVRFKLTYTLSFKHNSKSIRILLNLCLIFTVFKAKWLRTHLEKSFLCILSLKLFEKLNNFLITRLAEIFNRFSKFYFLFFVF